jgi:hypothetical protein
MSHVQNVFVDRDSWLVWRHREIIDDKCDDEVVIHMFSQLKEEHVVDAFSCYDVLIFDDEYFRFVCHWA